MSSSSAASRPPTTSASSSAAGWKPTKGCYPSKSPDPADELRAVRLHPPESEAYFIELLALPDAEQTEVKQWIPLELADGWYGLPSFRYLGVVASPTCISEVGLTYAAPAMMALANLLSHPEVGTVRMSEPTGGRKVLRSAKDLGRVLAIAWLAGRDETETWVDAWVKALEERFPHGWRDLARRAGKGLRELLEEDDDSFVEAHWTTDHGLLSGLNVTKAQLAVAGRRILVDVIDPLRERAG